MATNPPYQIPVRGDWSRLIMQHLYETIDKGIVPLNQFAIDVLKIKPDDIDMGREFDRALQGMEDLHQIIYKAKEKIEGGFKRRSLNDVEFSAVLHHDGFRIMSEWYSTKRSTNINLSSVLVALVAVLISLFSVIIQFTGKSDKELQNLNKQLRTQVQLLQSMQQSQKGIDASLHHIADSLGR